MHAATLSSKFQICIPKAIRKQMQLHAGQQFVFLTKGDVLYLLPKKDINEVRGILKGANTSNYRDHEDRI